MVDKIAMLDLITPKRGSADSELKLNTIEKFDNNVKLGNFFNTNMKKGKYDLKK